MPDNRSNQYHSRGGGARGRGLRGRGGRQSWGDGNHGWKRGGEAAGGAITAVPAVGAAAGAALTKKIMPRAIEQQPDYITFFYDSQSCCFPSCALFCLFLLLLFVTLVLDTVATNS